MPRCSLRSSAAVHALVFLRAARAVTAVIAGACAHFASAPGPVVTDRPGYSDAPTVLPVGALQLETGYTYDHVGDATYQTLGEALLRWGVQKRVELRGSPNSYVLRSDRGQMVRGVEDARLGAKVRLLRPDTARPFAPEVAVVIATTLPTGSARLSAGHVVPEAKFIGNWNVPHGASVLLNAGLLDIGQSSVSMRFAGSGALWYAAARRVATFVELFSATNLRGQRNVVRNADAGATYLIGDRTQFDVRVGRSIGDERLERFVGIGFARRW